MQHLENITPELYEEHVGDLVASIVCVGYVGGIKGAHDLCERQQKLWGKEGCETTINLICDVLENKKCNDPVVRKIVCSALWGLYTKESSDGGLNALADFVGKGKIK
jgi:hypothetical protein